MSAFDRISLVDRQKRINKKAFELSVNKSPRLFFVSPFVGDGNVTGKFELVYEECEENADNVEESPEVRLIVVKLFLAFLQRCCSPY